MGSGIPQFKKILFTTDLSKQTNQAFLHAAGLARQYGAGLTILFVMEEDPQVRSADFIDFLGKERWAEVRQSYEQAVRQALIGKKREGSLIRQALGEMLSTAQGRSGEKDLHADEIVVVQGDVVDCIVHEIRAREIDLLIMGYHARGRVAEAITGSVSRSVLRRVDVPVLLVKLPDGDR